MQGLDSQKPNKIQFKISSRMSTTQKGSSLCSSGIQDSEIQVVRKPQSERNSEKKSKVAQDYKLRSSIYHKHKFFLLQKEVKRLTKQNFVNEMTIVVLKRKCQQLQYKLQRRQDARSRQSVLQDSSFENSLSLQRQRPRLSRYSLNSDSIFSQFHSSQNDQITRATHQLSDMLNGQETYDTAGVYLKAKQFMFLDTFNPKQMSQCINYMRQIKQSQQNSINDMQSIEKVEIEDESAAPVENFKRKPFSLSQFKKIVNKSMSQNMK